MRPPAVAGHQHPDLCRNLPRAPPGAAAKTSYGTALANVDWLHGSAESLLTLTNLFIVLGMRGAIRKAEAANAAKAAAAEAAAGGAPAEERQPAAPRGD